MPGCCGNRKPIYRLLATAFIVSSVWLGFDSPGAPWGRTAIAGAETPASGAPPPPGDSRVAQPGAQGVATPHAVVPPGHEEVLSDILGRGVDLPGPCKFAGAQAEASLIRSSYACPKGTVVFELRHPSAAVAGAIKTAEFAMTLKSGSPPAGLADALAAHIRSREAAFQWQWIGAPPTP